VSQATPGKNGRIAFRRYFTADKTWGAIFTINPDGTGERQVTHPPKSSVDAPPRWAPDGSLIAFTRCPKRGRCAIYTVRPDGSQLTRLTPGCGVSAKCEDDTGASFLPDGRHVLFSEFTGGVGSSLVVADLHLRHRRVVVAGTKHASYVDPEFSPYGKDLVFVRKSEPGEKIVGVFVATARGGGRHQLSPTRLHAGDAPTWSPNGKWILFRSHVEDDGASQIYLVHPNGTGLKQLTHFKAGAIVTSSRFSPDGKWIVFGTNGVGGNADVFVMHANGSGMRPVTRTKFWDSAPGWGPAG
jgi:TolB protein